jgi:hypothetical protein
VTEECGSQWNIYYQGNTEETRGKLGQVAVLASSWKIAGSTPEGVIDIFSMHLILPAALGSGAYSASNRNEYQKISEDKALPACKTDNLTAICETPWPVAVITFPLCFVVIMCNVCFIVCEAFCDILFERGVLFCVICVFLCVVSYCSTTAAG